MAHFERNKAIISLMLGGRETLRSIAARFSMSHQNVDAILRRNGVALRFGRSLRAERQKRKAIAGYKEIIPRVSGDYNNGATAKELSVKYGIGEWKIRKALRSGGLKLRRGSLAQLRGTLSKNTNRVIQLSKGGYRFSEIVAETGLTGGHVGVIRSRYGLAAKRGKTAPRLAQWPYISNWSASRGGDDILKKVNDMVPKYLPDFVRADICQELILRVLEGKLELTQEAVRVATKEFYKMQPYLGAPISLDAPRYDGRSWHDLIADPSASVEFNADI